MKRTHLFDLKDITRNDLGSFNFVQATVTKDDSLQGQSLLQFLDNGTSLEFLDETDTGVEEQETANDTEIDPVLETSRKNGSSLDRTRNVSCTAHDMT